MKYATVTHIRCQEPDGTTYGFVPDEWTQEQFEEAVYRAKKAYAEATDAYYEELKENDLMAVANYWGAGAPPYDRYPDKTVKEVKELHAAKIEEKKRQKAILDKARWSFGDFLRKEGFTNLTSADAEMTTKIDWGHQHGKKLEYEDTWPGYLDKQGAGKVEEED